MNAPLLAPPADLTEPGPSARVDPRASTATRTAAGPRPRLAPGERVGPYLVIDVLAVGGQAVIYRAAPPGPSPRVVALKLFGAARDAAALRPAARLCRGARRGGPQAGSGILPVLGWGTHRGLVYLASPLVDGATLAGLVRQRRSRPAGRRPAHRLAALPEAAYLRRVCRQVARVARAAAVTHAAGLAHGDIKPSNILLDAAGRAWLADFGSARPLGGDATGMPAAASGTPLYMAPELWHDPGAVDDVACDVYGLGATLYEAATLRPPHAPPAGLAVAELAVYLASSRPVPPRAARPGLSRGLSAILERALDPAPARRYPTAAAMAAALERLAAGVGPGVSQGSGRRPPMTDR